MVILTVCKFNISNTHACIVHQSGQSGEGLAFLRKARDEKKPPTEVEGFL
jgi:hypothetical protein